MSVRTSAARYARVLLEVSIEEADAAAVERELTAFASMIDSHDDLKRVLFSPSVPTTVRKQIVAAIGAKAGYAAPLAKLLVMLAERGRLDLVPDLLDVYRERLRAHSSIVKGAVSSASPLEPERLRALEQSLSQTTGKQVQLDAAVDPSLIGGVVARIGSTVYDGSIRTQLQRIRQQLVETA